MGKGAALQVVCKAGCCPLLQERRRASFFISCILSPVLLQDRVTVLTASAVGQASSICDMVSCAVPLCHFGGTANAATYVYKLTLLDITGE